MSGQGLGDLGFGQFWGPGIFGAFKNSLWGSLEDSCRVPLRLPFKVPLKGSWGSEIRSLALNPKP